MPMIKCPECGKEISSNAKTCPHCGCAITVCPDCHTPYINAPAVCKNCGYEFNKQNPEEKHNDEILTHFVKNLKNINKIVYISYAILTIILLFVLIVSFLRWDKEKDILLKVANASSTLDTINSLIIIATILSILFSIYDKPDDFKWLHLLFAKKVMTDKKIDGKNYCRTYFQNNISSADSKKYFTILYAAYYQDNKNEEKKVYIYTVISAIFVIASNICGTLFIINSVDYVFNCFFNTTEYSKAISAYFSKFSTYTLAIIDIVLQIINSIITRIYMTTPQRNNIKNWCADNNIALELI